MDVILNVYDLSDNSCLYPIGLGAYHTGVEISGVEYTYAHVMDGTGVCLHDPKGAPGCLYRESLVLGKTRKSSAEVQRTIDQLRENWRGV